MGDLVSFPGAVEKPAAEQRAPEQAAVAAHVNPALAGMLYISVDLLEKLVVELRTALGSVPLGADQARMDQNCRAMIEAIEAAKLKLAQSGADGISRAGNPPA